MSAKLVKAKLVIDEPAHVLRKAKRPRVRKLEVSLALEGRHTEIYDCVLGGSPQRISAKCSKTRV